MSALWQLPQDHGPGLHALRRGSLMTVDDPFEDAVYEPQSPSLLKYDAKVLRGKNGRLFLDNDRNNVIKQLTGELRFSDQQLLEWRALLEARVSWLDKRGCRYFFLVAVNAHLVY